MRWSRKFALKVMLVTVLALVVLWTVPVALDMPLDLLQKHPQTELELKPQIDLELNTQNQFHPQLELQNPQIKYSNIQKLIQDPQNQLLFLNIDDSKDCFYDPRTSVVGTAHFHRENRYQRQPYVSNGFIGARIPNLGQGFAYDYGDGPNSHIGWPQFNRRYAGAFAAGFYDLQPNTTANNFPELLANGWESIISAIPQWTTLEVLTKINGTWYHLDGGGGGTKTITQYVQTMALGDGRVTTEFVWMDVVHVTVEVLANRAVPTAGLVRVLVQNLDGQPLPVMVEDRLDFSTSQRCEFVDAGTDPRGIFMRVRPQAVGETYGTIFSRLTASANASSAVEIDQNGTIVRHKSTAILAPNTIMHWYKTVGIATTDLDPDLPPDDVALARQTALISYHQAEQLHRDACHELAAKIVFPGDRLLTLAAQASLHHLTANTRAHARGTTAAVGVSGLSSDSYGGMVFWDTDLWMLGGLMPFAPAHAASIVNYRVHTHRQAQRNIPDQWHHDSRPSDADDGSNDSSQFGPTAAVYPWTSGRYGNCTATGPCFDYEYHINVAVASAAFAVYLAGHHDDTYLKSTVLPLVLDAAQFFARLVLYNDTLAAYTTTNLTDPDEYANHVNNGAYTNAGIARLMSQAVDIASHLQVPIPAIYADIATKMYLPRSSHGVVLEYSEMPPDITVKQADVVMVTYPLENSLILHHEARTSAQYYALKQDRHGPAMTHSIYSAVLLALNLGCSALSFLRMAVQPVIRAPFAQFLEQAVDDTAANGGTAPAFPFLTAHGGSLQAIVQGFLGLRFAYRVEDGTIHRHLVLNPRYVPGGLEIYSMNYFNSTFDLLMNKTMLAVHHHGPGPSITAIVLNGDPITIDPHSTAYFAVNLPPSSPGVCLCAAASVYNITAGLPGDAIILINDGYNFTFWQADPEGATTNGTAKILVDLHEPRTITHGHINWGDMPPEWYRVAVLQDGTPGPTGPNYHDDWSTPEQVLGTVDFGTNLHERYLAFRTGPVVAQDDVFTVVELQEVLPIPPEHHRDFAVTSSWNTSDFAVEFTGRFVLLEMTTAKIHQVILY